MLVDILVPGPLYLEGGGRPVYCIDGKGYDPETLRELPKETWVMLTSVGVELPLGYEWTSQPLLLTTIYGGIVVETNPGGEFKIISRSSGRTLESSIVAIYQLAVPILEDSKVIGSRLLSPADKETIHLFEMLKKNQFSLNQSSTSTK